ncbi:MAG: flagellar biosynthesis protein FlhB [Burkholderiales bacterium]
MAEEHDSERTESASPRRLEQAREEGNVARSQELTTFALLMAGAGGLWFGGVHFFQQMCALVQRGLQLDAATPADTTQMSLRLYEQSFGALSAVAPVLLLLLVVAFLVPQLLSGWLFTWSALRFDFQRLDPVAGVARIISWRGLAELIKALVKSTLIAVVGVAVIWHYREPLQQLSSLPVDAGIAQASRIAGVSFLIVAGVLALVAAADVPFQIWRHTNDLKMSREELRREQRENEGDPQLKAAIRNQQRAMARRRMMTEVPNASVIVTNPTHYAVALRYDDQRMGAPRVIAKGADLVAAKIREVGEQHHVPVLESPALARAMYHHAEIGAEIPEKLYAAVAEVLAYVFQLRRYHDHGGAAPKPLTPVAVPAEMDPLETRGALQ